VFTVPGTGLRVRHHDGGEFQQQELLGCKLEIEVVVRFGGRGRATLQKQDQVLEEGV
jgi:hypothetical protein